MARAHPASPADHGYPRGGLHGQVVHTIGRRILSGAIRPGELLPVDPGLRASRTVLREAIKVLAAEGLVESRPKTGTRVRPPEFWNLLDPDVLAWQRACAAGLPEEAHRGASHHRDGGGGTGGPARATGGPDRPSTPLPGDGRGPGPVARGLRVLRPGGHPLHRAILQACDNDVLEQMSAMVYSALLVSFHATSRLPGRARSSLPQHRAILLAIRGHQPRRAGAAMRRLVETTAEAMAKRCPGSGGAR